MKKKHKKVLKSDKSGILLHFTDSDLQTLYEIADKQDRSRKNFCENEIRKIIQAFERGTITK